MVTLLVIVVEGAVVSLGVQRTNGAQGSPARPTKRAARASAATEPRHRHQRPDRKSSARERSLELLAKEGRPMSVAEVALKIGESRKTTKNALHRAWKRGEAVRVDWGLYAANLQAATN